MAKFGADGTHIYIQNLTATAPSAITIVSASNAKPVVVDVGAGDIGKFNDGDVVYITGTGLTSADGKYWLVANKGTTDFELKGSDATGAGGPGAAGNATPYEAGATKDLEPACMASISLNTQDPSSIDTSDLCGTGQILGAAQPPSISFNGFVDPAKEGFKELVRAGTENPKQDRVIRIDFPNNNGSIFGVGQVGSVSFTAGTGAAVEFSGSAAFNSMPTIDGWV